MIPVSYKEKIPKQATSSRNIRFQNVYDSLTLCSRDDFPYLTEYSYDLTTKFKKNYRHVNTVFNSGRIYVNMPRYDYITLPVA